MDRHEKSRSKSDCLKQVVDQIFLSDEIYEDVLKSSGIDNAQFMKALIEDAALSDYLQKKLCMERLRIYVEYLKYIPTVFLKLLSLMNNNDEDPKSVRSICTDYLNLHKQFSDFSGPPSRPGSLNAAEKQDDPPKENFPIKPETASKMLELLANDAPKKETRITNLRFQTDDPTEKPEPPPFSCCVMRSE